MPHCYFLRSYTCGVPPLQFGQTPCGAALALAGLDLRALPVPAGLSQRPSQIKASKMLLVERQRERERERERDRDRQRERIMPKRQGQLFAGAP